MSVQIPRSKKPKIVILGDGGVGKTTYIKRFLTGEFIKSYDPTIGTQIDALPFTTSDGKVVLEIWDCAGQEKYSGLGDGYYISADAAIIMIDLTRRITLVSAVHWYVKLMKMKPKIPIVFVGNKSDSAYVQLSPKFVQDYLSGKNIPDSQYYTISAKSNYNHEKPFLHLLSKLMKNDSLSFVEGSPTLPPEIKIDELPLDALVLNDGGDDENENENENDDLDIVRDEIDSIIGEMDFGNNEPRFDEDYNEIPTKSYLYVAGNRTHLITMKSGRVFEVKIDIKEVTKKEE